MVHPLVLLVEPFADDRDMYSEYLRVRGFAVDACAGADTAFDRAAAADAIVTAIRLHGPYDGVEFVRRLRADRRTEATPIIVLTASTFTDDRQRAYAAGCDAFLLKPCLPDTLANEIRRVVRSARRSRANHRLSGSNTSGVAADSRPRHRPDRRRAR
jgi:two-component system, cell cycle response regulator DivK